MASVVQICNLALSEIRASSINNLREGSLAADLCALHYPIARDQVLRDAPWQFAHKIAPLALLDMSQFKVFNWAYTYQYPGDALLLNRLIINFESVEADQRDFFVRYRYRDEFLENFFPNVRAQVEYEILNVNNTKVIVANEPQLRVDYVSQVDNPQEFDSLFTIAVAHLLASRIAVGLVGVELGLQLKSVSLQQYQLEIDAAIAANNNEQYHYVNDSDLVTVRN